MSDSEPKPAKKATKKAAAKKQTAVGRAADVIAGPTGEQVLDLAETQVAEAITDALIDGLPEGALLGSAVVTLHIPIEGALTAEEAVQTAIYEIARRGLNYYTFVVRDEDTDELHGVRDGELVSLDVAGAADDEDDED